MEQERAAVVKLGGEQGLNQELCRGLSQIQQCSSLETLMFVLLLYLSCL